MRIIIALLSDRICTVSIASFVPHNVKMLQFSILHLKQWMDKRHVCVYIHICDMIIFAIFLKLHIVITVGS